MIKITYNPVQAHITIKIDFQTVFSMCNTNKMYNTFYRMAPSIVTWAPGYFQLNRAAMKSLPS